MNPSEFEPAPICPHVVRINCFPQEEPVSHGGNSFENAMKQEAEAKPLEPPRHMKIDTKKNTVKFIAEKRTYPDEEEFHDAEFKFDCVLPSDLSDEDAFARIKESL
eukprot:gene15488-647_t